MPNKATTVAFYSSPVSAGFPSPADDFIENSLDLNEHLIKHRASTFFVKVDGDSMINAGISSGDTLIVDRSLEAIHGSIVVALINGEFTVKRLNRYNKAISLVPENPRYKPLHVTDGTNFEVWGVVTYVIHRCK